MDLQDFIKNGVNVPNPNYKKGSKDPKLSQKTIISNDINDAYDGASAFGEALINNSYDLTYLENDKNKYGKYNVHINPINTQEELNKERANNQSIFEQATRSVGQMAVNEVAIGTVLGVSNLVDAGINLFKGEGENDYTNPISSFLESKREEISNAWSIYQKNPEASWQIGDFGWWAQNAVSVASTASLLIPTLGATKGLSFLGKITNASKLTRGMAKAAKGVGLTNKPATLAKTIETGTEIGLNALFSRTMEGYLEARDVYKNAYDNTFNEISNFTDEQRNAFLNKNPQYNNKTNEEIAKDVAGLSADETYKNDFAMLLMDVAQFKALSSLWKGAKAAKPTAALRKHNESSIKSLVGKADDVVEKISKVDKFKEYIKKPIEAIGVSWTEAIEEGYQGIQSQKGEEVYQRILNPNFVGKSFSDYLADPTIWEQAFWGVLGGMGFQAAGNAIGNVSNKLKAKANKNNLSDEEIALSKLGYEKQRAIEINGRKAIIQDYVDKISRINNGQHDSKAKKDIKTGRDIIEDGNIAYENISPEEQEVRKEVVTNEFITNLALGAADVGNYELLKEYINSPEFNKYFEDLGINNTTGDKTFAQSLVQKMDETYEHYSKALYDIFDSVDVEYEGVAKATARKLSRRKLDIAAIDNVMSELDDSISSIEDSHELTSAYEEQFKIEYVNNYIKGLNEESIKLDNLRKSKQISKQAYEQYKEDINYDKNRMLEYLSNNSAFGNETEVLDILKNAFPKRNVSEFTAKFNKFYKQFNEALLPEQQQSKPKESVQNFVRTKVQLDAERFRLSNSEPKTQDDYQREYDDVLVSAYNIASNKFNKALTNVGNWLEQQDDVELAFASLFEDVLPKNIKDDLDILKIGHGSTELYAAQLGMILNSINTKKGKQAEKEKEVKVNGVKVNPKQAETIKSEIEDNASSTGENIKTPITNVTDPNTIPPTKTTTTIIEDDSVPIPTESIEKNIEELDVKLAESIAKQGEEILLNVDNRASGIASSIVLNLYKQSRSLFDNLDGKDQTSREFNDLVNIVANELLLQGVSANLVRQSAINGLKLSLPIIGRRKGVNNFITLADSLSIKQHIVFSEEEDRYSVTSIIPDNEINSVIEQFIESYVSMKGIITAGKSKTIVNIASLFDELLQNEDIGYEQAKYIFRNIIGYINNNKSPKYIFTNTKLLKGTLNNPDSFFEQLKLYKEKPEIISTYMHTKVSNNINDFGKGLLANMKGPLKGYVIRTGNSLSVRVDKNELAFIARVKMSKDGNTLSIDEQKTGFVREITKTSEGAYDDTLDILYVPVINRQEDGGFNKIFEALLKHHQWKIANKDNISGIYGLNVQTDKDLINAVINNKVVNELIKEKKIIIPEWNTTDVKKANYILEQLGSVIFYNVEDMTSDALMDSYNNWKYSIYENYRQTLDIQNRVDKGEQVEVDIVNFNGSRLILNDTNTDIKDIGFTYDKNPIISVNNDNTISVEGTDRPYINRGRYAAGSMGLLINNNPDAPTIAFFTEANKLTSNTNLTNDVKVELTKLFTDFTSGNITFDEITNSLADLFSGPNFDNNSLFSGYNVVSTANLTSLNIAGEKGKYTITIFRNKKDSDEAGVGLYYSTNGDKTKSTMVKTTNKKLMDKMVNEIISNLSFNRTFFALRNKSEKNTNSNKYLYKENGKIVVKIGKDKGDVYENFAHFVLANNAFKTNQGVNDNGGFTEIIDDVTSIYINSHTKTLPVEELSTTTTKSVKEQIENATNDNPANTNTVLESAGVTKDQIDILNGKNEYEIDLISKNIFYDSKLSFANGVYRQGKVFITKKGISAITKSSKDAIRILMHEHLHSKVSDTSIIERANIVNDLLDTYDEFIINIQNDLNTLDAASQRYADAKTIYDFIIKNNFTPENYSKGMGVKERELFNNKTEEERNRIFAEEWLVESITQPALINYLNNTNYKNEIVSVSDIDVVNKSIWQKIIDILLKLFGKAGSNIKNNTILAKQYSILGDIKTEDINNDKQSDKQVTTPDVSDTNDIFDSTVDDITIDHDIDDVELYTVTNIIETSEEIALNNFENNNTLNPNGLIQISDMSSFVKRFPTNVKDNIKNMINNNNINFICK